MAAAEVGDEQAQEDPTVNELQRRAAELLGHEAALFLPTATMANQIALRVLTRPGEQLIAEERTHILIFEAGGPAVHSGLMARPLTGDARADHAASSSRDGRRDRGLAPAGEHRRRSSRRTAAPAGASGRSTSSRRDRRPPASSGSPCTSTARACSTPPSRAASPPPSTARLADTVQICFSKGLGCPMGAILAGSEERIEQAWRLKFLFGGALRQAGCRRGGDALRARPQRRAARRGPRAREAARRRARRGGPPGRPRGAETNFVGIDVASLGLDAREAHGRIAERGRAASVSCGRASCASPRTSASPTRTSTARSS